MLMHWLEWIQVFSMSFKATLFPLIPLTSFVELAVAIPRIRINEDPNIETTVFNFFLDAYI